MSRPTTTTPPAPEELDDPDAPISDEEVAAAAALASGLGAGAAQVASVEQAELLALATTIQAVHGRLELDPLARSQIVERALAQAVGGHAAAPAVADQLAARRGSGRRAVGPLAALGAALAVAAALIIFVGGRRPAATPTAATAVAPASVPASWRSRPSDALVGEITPATSTAAADRIGVIFRDRMDAFRARSLAGGGL